MGERLDPMHVREIAQIASEQDCYGVENFIGYFVVWENDDNSYDYAIAINKECDADGGNPYYAIYVSGNGAKEDNNWWEYTDDLSTDGLVDHLERIIQYIEEMEG